MSELHYFRPEWIEKSDRVLRVDVCVYGGTSAGVIAAVQARNSGHSVALLQPGKFIGGMTTGGLGWTDYGQKDVIGGLSRDFYRRCGRRYGKDEEFHFEPHVATAVYNDMLKEQQIEPLFCQYVDRVEKDGNRIVALITLGGSRVEAKVFIDASYEGDLMARAGVSYTVGRESNAKYNETLNGIQVRPLHQFSHPVDPYLDGKLLPHIESDDLSTKQGSADQRVQAYCFRVCMTDDPALKIAWEKPDGFDPQEYVLAARWFAGEKDEYNDQLPAWPDELPDVPKKFDTFPNKTPGGFYKTDTNNHGPVSSDYIGANYEWPDGCYECRERIFQAHVTYQRGFYWFMANSDQIPDRYRTKYARWGLPRDEFTQTENWPHQLYIREARRMVGDYVVTERDCMSTLVVDDPIAMGSYAMDSHNCSRFVTTDKQTGKPRVSNDGDFQVRTPQPYKIAYRSIVPRAKECENLLVPVCLSASHVAYGSARMEPVFMALGQSAALAAHIAIRDGIAVQQVQYTKLQPHLLDAHQVLHTDDVNRTNR